MKSLLCHAKKSILFAGLMLLVSNVQATLLTDLQALNLDAGNLQTKLQATSLNSDTVCAPLLELNQDARALLDSVTRIEESLTAPLQVDTDILNALDQLATTSTGLASETLRLSVDLNAGTNPLLFQVLQQQVPKTRPLPLSCCCGAWVQKQVDFFSI